MNRMPGFILPAIILGAALVAFPFFFLRLALVALIVGAAFRFIRRQAFGGGAGWGGRNHWQSRRVEFTDRIRRMSDEEYAAFNQKEQPLRTIQIEPLGRHREDFVL